MPDNCTNLGQIAAMNEPKEAQELAIGILSIQGAFAEHEYSLDRAFDRLKELNLLCQKYSLKIVNVRSSNELAGLHGLIIPGGESTTMSIQLKRANFIDSVLDFVSGKNMNTKPMVWGTCAGLILLANKVEQQKQTGQITIGGLDVTASRNLFGRQRESFVTPITLVNEGIQNSLENAGNGSCQGVFIRAPGIVSVDSSKAEVLATAPVNGECTVAVKQDNLMATTFHPELTEDLRWHAYFIKGVIQQLNSTSLSK